MNWNWFDLIRFVRASSEFRWCACWLNQVNDEIVGSWHKNITKFNGAYCDESTSIENTLTISNVFCRTSYWISFSSFRYILYKQPNSDGIFFSGVWKNFHKYSKLATVQHHWFTMFFHEFFCFLEIETLTHSFLVCLMIPTYEWMLYFSECTYILITCTHLRHFQIDGMERNRIRKLTIERCTQQTHRIDLN